MKNYFNTHPNISRFIVGAILITAALLGSAFIHIPFVPVGLVLVVFISWLMFRSEGKNLSVLGFDLKASHLLLIPFGLLLGIASFLLSFYVGVWVRHDQVMVSKTIDWGMLITEFWRVLPTAAVQDFLVVGYCYTKLIQLTNKRIATLMFALFFIAMHDVWGGYIVNTLFYASGLFMGYLMFSTSFLRSGSIWLPIGLHWGNNFANSCLFTFNRTSTSWLYLNTQHSNLNVWQAVGLFIALIIGAVCVIIITRLVWRKNLFMEREYPQKE
ncbi:MAG: CPBP family intramembrane glutamic endopeptidase [Mucilaginibacter sp.]